MSHGPELDRLALRWAARPTSTCYAALAEGLRKSGALDEAERVAVAGIRARPDYLPGHLVLARIYRDQRRWRPAEDELRLALTLDATHPVVIDALKQLTAPQQLAPLSELAAESEPPESFPDEAPEEPSDLVFTDDLTDGSSVDDAAVLTESLAMVYWSQGHLDRAVEVFDALVDRAPASPELVSRRDAARRELVARKPQPFDAAESGGRGVRDWLQAVAAVRPPPQASKSSFDAFYQSAAPEPPRSGDLAAFKSWLQELHR